MAIDPDELKVRRIKREEKVHEIQNYMEEQAALDEQNKTGKLGPHSVKKQDAASDNIAHIIASSINFLKGK